MRHGKRKILCRDDDADGTWVYEASGKKGEESTTIRGGPGAAGERKLFLRLSMDGSFWPSSASAHFFGSRVVAQLLIYFSC
jgi:hypothetical protein